MALDFITSLGRICNISKYFVQVQPIIKSVLDWGREQGTWSGPLISYGAKILLLKAKVALRSSSRSS